MVLLFIFTYRQYVLQASFEFYDTAIYQMSGKLCENQSQVLECNTPQWWKTGKGQKERGLSFKGLVSSALVASPSLQLSNCRDTLLLI